LTEEAAQLSVTGSQTQGTFEVKFLGGEQARTQASGGGEAQAVAALAVVLRDGANKANGPLKPRGVHYAGRSRSGLGDYLFHNPQGQEALAYLVYGQEVPDPVVMGDGGHELDETHLQGMVPGQEGEIQELVIVYPVQDHTVDLEGLKSHGRCPPQTRHHQVESVGAGDFLVALGTQGIEAQVQVAQTYLKQVLSHLSQKHAVGGEGDLFQSGHFPKTSQKVHHISAHQGLATGDPDLADAGHDRYPGKTQKLLVAQDLRSGELFPALSGQAVKAPQIAAIGDGETQIVDVAAGTVVHGEVLGWCFPYFILRRAPWVFFLDG
jgi:hypothetical protein